jgi:hypothetical protein
VRIYSRQLLKFCIAAGIKGMSWQETTTRLQGNVQLSFD